MSKIETAEILYTPKLPYIVIPALEGDEYYFSEAYVHLIDDAFYTGCLSAMSTMQLRFFNDFCGYESGVEVSSDPDALAELDAVLAGLVNGVAIPTPSCG